MIYTVFESTNMASTKFAEPIFDAVANVDIENGTFGYLGELANGESVTYNFVSGTEDGKQIVVVDNPPWDENTSFITNQRRDKYIIPAGTKFRVRVVKKNDRFGISAEGITPATRESLSTGAFLTIDATTGKLVASDTSALTINSEEEDTAPIVAFEAKIERQRISGGTLVTAAHNYGYSRVMYEAIVKTLA